MTRDEILTAEEVEGKNKEKQITELEQEAEKYLDKKYLKDMGVRNPCRKAYLAGAEPREKRIAELEKENVQLKEANETLATMNNNMWVELEKKRAESQGITNKLHQLIEAKELIGKFSDFANLEVEYDPEHPQEHTDLWNELCKKAEAFLKE